MGALIYHTHTHTHTQDTISGFKRIINGEWVRVVCVCVHF